MDEIIKLIIEGTKEERRPERGTLGMALYEMAQRHLAGDKEIELDLDDDEARKIIALKEHEKNQDLCWMDFDSWNALGQRFKESFTHHVDPLIWSGLYFQFSKFIDNMEPIVTKLDGYHSINILKYANAYRILGFNSQRVSIYDYMNPTDLERMRKQFSLVLYMAIGFSPKTKKLVVKRYQEDRDEQKDSDNTTS